MSNFFDEDMTIEEQYKYIISQNKIYTQADFSQKYFDKFGKKVTQSAIAHNFKRYNIKKTKDGYYRAFPNVAYINEPLSENELVDKLYNVLEDNKNRDKDEIVDNVKHILLKYSLSDDKLTLNEIFSRLISDIVYSYRDNVVIIYLNTQNDISRYDLIKKICAVFYDSFHRKYETVSIIPCYDTIILFSISTQEMLEFCYKIKKEYFHKIKGVPKFE